jgi:ketosteroid isomerase-like protein
MSEANVAFIREAYDLFNAVGRTGEEFVDPESVAPDLWARLAPDFELHGRPDVPDSAVYRGPEEAKGFFRMLQEVWAEVRWEPLSVTDLGDAIVVETKLVAQGRGSDVWLEADEAQVFWFRDGSLTRLQGFPSMEQALEAAGSQ